MGLLAFWFNNTQVVWDNDYCRLSWAMTPISPAQYTTHFIFQCSIQSTAVVCSIIPINCSFETTWIQDQEFQDPTYILISSCLFWTWMRHHDLWLMSSVNKWWPRYLISPCIIRTHMQVWQFKMNHARVLTENSMKPWPEFKARSQPHNISTTDAKLHTFDIMKYKRNSSQGREKRHLQLMGKEPTVISLSITQIIQRDETSTRSLNSFITTFSTPKITQSPHRLGPNRIT